MLSSSPTAFSQQKLFPPPIYHSMFSAGLSLTLSAMLPSSFLPFWSSPREYGNCYEQRWQRKVKLQYTVRRVGVRELNPWLHKPQWDSLASGPLLQTESGNPHRISHLLPATSAAPSRIKTVNTGVKLTGKIPDQNIRPTFPSPAWGSTSHTLRYTNKCANVGIWVLLLQYGCALLKVSSEKAITKTHYLKTVVMGSTKRRSSAPTRGQRTE